MSVARRTFNRLLATAALGLGACGRRDEAGPPGASSSPQGDAPAATRPDAKRFLALGDSYTIGESVAPDQRWPVQLVARLREQGVNLADAEIIARTGWRTDDLDAAITRAAPKGPYDLVTLLIGVNNQYQGRSVDEYREEFPALLGRSVALAGGDASRVIVLSIPDWGATPYGAGIDPAQIARAIDAFNAVNRETSEKLGVRYVDVTPVSRLAPSQPALVANDGLHPSGKMYAEWVTLVLPQAAEVLRR